MTHPTPPADDLQATAVVTAEDIRDLKLAVQNLAAQFDRKRHLDVLRWVVLMSIVLLFAAFAGLAYYDQTKFNQSTIQHREDNQQFKSQTVTFRHEVDAAICSILSAVPAGDPPIDAQRVKFHCGPAKLPPFRVPSSSA